MSPLELELRLPKYMSPSSLKLFWDDREDYFKKYLAPNRPPRRPQTEAMSVGSSFDGYVKNALMHDLYGNDIPEEFELGVILDAQVSEHVRDFAFPAGEHVFDAYVRSGAYKELLVELRRSPVDPMFEFDASGQVSVGDIVDSSVTLFGKPDIWYKTPSGADVIRDWKVNGYCAKNGHSPKKEYILIRDGWDHEIVKPSKAHNVAHKSALIGDIKGVPINKNSSFETIDSGWADQICIYSWLQGIPVGGELIIGIEQLCCTPLTFNKLVDMPEGAIKKERVPESRPLIRVAKHMATVSPDYQFKLMARAQKAWDLIHDGHIFDWLPREESDAKCLKLALVCDTLNNMSPEEAEFHRSIATKGRW